jgi:hypothetical protein
VPITVIVLDNKRKETSMSRKLAIQVIWQESEIIEKEAKANEGQTDSSPDELIQNLHDSVMEGCFDHIENYDEMLNSMLSYL